MMQSTVLESKQNSEDNTREVIQEQFCVNILEYKIERIKKSEVACIFFAQDKLKKQQVVIKVLQSYKDNRYDFSTLEKRQQSQREALRINQKFTDGIYDGLSAVYTPDEKPVWDCEKGDTIYLEGLVSDAREAAKRLGTLREYALIMKELPLENRLDQLLIQASTSEAIQSLLDALIQRIVQLHQDNISHPLSKDSDKNNNRWGYPEQIQKKLAHNFTLYDLIAKRDEELHQKYKGLKRNLRVIVSSPCFKQYFLQRVTENQIKHCHGDLKADNIWISTRKSEKLDRHSNKAGRRDRHNSKADKMSRTLNKVLILDAIDFNDSYNHIDTLSDLAMLAIDIEAYTEKQWISGYIFENYKKQTKFNNTKAAENVFKYYLAEKALVRAAVSICFDHDRDDLPREMGKKFLMIADRNANELMEDIRQENHLYYLVHRPPIEPLLHLIERGVALIQGLPSSFQTKKGVVSVPAR
jgi:aminoglycoside phosphotransferase family enzyme